MPLIGVTGRGADVVDGDVAFAPLAVVDFEAPLVDVAPPVDDVGGFGANIVRCVVEVPVAELDVQAGTTIAATTSTARPTTSRGRPVGCAGAPCLRPAWRAVVVRLVPGTVAHPMRVGRSGAGIARHAHRSAAWQTAR
jgi:hypothetical protein